jgi:hypothetical protein
MNTSQILKVYPTLVPKSAPIRASHPGFFSRQDRRSAVRSTVNSPFHGRQKGQLPAHTPDQAWPGQRAVRSQFARHMLLRESVVSAVRRINDHGICHSHLRPRRKGLRDDPTLDCRTSRNLQPRRNGQRDCVGIGARQFARRNAICKCEQQRIIASENACASLIDER